MTPKLKLPTSTKALILRTSRHAKDPVYHDARLETIPIPGLKSGQVLVQVSAVGFNRRDYWIRRNLYPGIALGSVLGSDFAGVVIASTIDGDDLIGRRVFGHPCRGWQAALDGPEGPFGVAGGVKFPEFGAFAEHVVVEREELIESCAHLDDVHMAAWPVAGLTAWRAIVVHGNVRKGQNVLITGIGGGVAMIVLQICVALGANVWVTSSDERKVLKAVELGAKGGVNYNLHEWYTALQDKLGPGNLLDVVIDSAGGDICAQTRKVLKYGGIIVCYGMTSERAIPFTMRDVMRNIQLKGSTLGSHKELRDATNFLSRHKIVPIVGQIVNGLESAEECFRALAVGSQLGKVVIRIDHQRARL